MCGETTYPHVEKGGECELAGQVQEVGHQATLNGHQEWGAL